MTDDTERYAAELIPSDYTSWHYCIEVKCGIPVSQDFVRERIRILADPGHEEAQRFARTYGSAHLQRVLSWLRQSAETLDTNAGESRPSRGGICND